MFRSVVVAVVALATLTFFAPAFTTLGAPPSEPAWGDDARWEVLMPGGLTAVKGKAPKPFYVIAPVDAAAPQSVGRWGFGPHDNVVRVPPFRDGGGGGTCLVALVVPGPGGEPGVNIDVVEDANLGIPLVRAADLDGDGTLDPLTSTAKVEAANGMGLVSLFVPRPGGEPIGFHCPVRPLRG